VEIGSQIVVRGTASARVLPDRAVLQVAVDGEAGSREDAYRQAAALAGRVDEVLRTREASLDRVTTAALLVQPRTRWRKGETVRTGWRASRTTVLEVVELAILGDLTVELAAAGGAITGPTWRLDPANAVYAEVRGLAAEDARERARAYAAALDLRVVGVAWVAEPGLRVGNQYPQPAGFGAMAPAAARRSAAVDEEVIEVAVDELNVDASVEVAFEFAPASG
jgi:uncharacterized protein YggE